MTKFLSIGVCFLMVACQQAPAAGVQHHENDPSFTIEGSIKGVTNGMAILNYVAGRKVLADTSRLKDGHFYFNGSLQEPQEVQLSFVNDAYNGAISFFAENSTIKINADTASLTAPAINGSMSQEDLAALKKDLQPVLLKSDQLTAAGRALFRTGNAGKKQADSLAGIYQSIDLEKVSVINAFVNTHPSSAVSAWAINKYLLVNPRLEILEPLFAQLAPTVQTSLYGSLVNEALLTEKATAIGQPAIAFTLPDVNGKQVSLTSLRGRYVLVDFWASWCGPCRKENPSLLKAYNRYKSKGIEIIGVSMDTDKAAWQKAIKNDQLPWKQVSDLKGWNSTVATAYAIKGIPFNLLLDKDGRIIAKNLRGAALADKLQELLP